MSAIIGCKGSLVIPFQNFTSPEDMSEENLSKWVEREILAGKGIFLEYLVNKGYASFK